MYVVMGLYGHIYIIDGIMGFISGIMSAQNEGGSWSDFSNAA